MNALNIQTIQWLLSYSQWTLVLWAILWLTHCVRVFRHSWLCPKILQYKRRYDKVSEARAVIQHENELMNHRLLWLLTAEGLLFAALGLAMSKDNAAVAQQLIPVLSFVGIALAASASIILDAGDAAILHWSPPCERDNPEGDVIGYRGLPFVGLLAPWRIYPPMFIIAWYIVGQM